MNRTILAPLLKLIAFATVTVLLTAVLAQTLGSLADGGTRYRARFTDVTGLLVGDDVRIAGVRVGQVAGIRVVENSVAEVSFTVTGDIPLPASVRATVRYRNLVGQRYLALQEGPGEGQPLPPDALIPITQTRPALDLTVLFNGFRPLFTALDPEDVNKLAYEIIQVLQGEGGTVASLLQRTASLTTTLADSDEVISRVITNLNSVLATFDGREQQLDRTVSQLRQFVSGLAADRRALGEALVNLADLTGTTASLLRDSRPAIKADVAALGELAGTLNRNATVIDGALGRLPDRYAGLTRVASHGSWFNFFLCDFDGRVNVAGRGTLDAPDFHSPATRCTAAGGTG